MKRRIFLFSGEGTRWPETEPGLLKQSALWSEIESELSTAWDLDLEQLWDQEAGQNRCPYSPLLTVVSQLCLADLWCRWGFKPDVCLGHSTGELAAAYQAGLYSLKEVLKLALQIGEAGGQLEGQMIHGSLADAQLADLSVQASSLNFRIDERTHVTVSGQTDELEAFIEQHPQFVKMKLPHPWHHRGYQRHADQIDPIDSAEIAPGRFISGVTTKVETRLEPDHWRRWLTTRIDFIRAMQTLADELDDEAPEVIEIGSHPVLAKCCHVLGSPTHVSSMYRGQDDGRFIVGERRKLDQTHFIEGVGAAVHALKPALDLEAALAVQGVDSVDMVELTAVLKRFFPGLQPQDLFRYKSLNLLIDGFGSPASASAEGDRRAEPNRRGVVISGMSCRFPTAAETLPQFWDLLKSGQDQVRKDATRGHSEAGYLDGQVTRFDHQFFDISVAEARTMDPQQMLALELTELLWRDAGIDPQTLDRRRVGVYLGVWNQDFRGDRSSVYTPTGTNPSVIAARISYHYDLRGPSWVSNTACSSSLVAVHYAAKDIEAGRVDYAIVGGVNMLLDERFSATMRGGGFLSPDHRCKTFDDSADGYVRAEGGGLLLLTSSSLAHRYYAELSGSATNQNGGRAQVITAPHPEAQEEVITEACGEAGIAPQDIAYLECHGTGTKLGDPIELSAIQNTVAAGRTDPVYLGSVKSNIGHLESASGIAGLIKSVLAVNKGLIPPNLHFNLPNTYIDFDAHHLEVVTKETPLDHEAYCGVSSFGFGGSNAHVVIKGASASVRKEILPVVAPFNRERSTPLQAYVHLLEQGDSPPKHAAGQQAKQEPPHKGAAVATFTLESLGALFDGLFTELTRVQEILPDVELTDQGLDSLAATELISNLQDALGLELEPELLFEFPLRDELLDEIFSLSGDRAATSQLG